MAFVKQNLPLATLGTFGSLFLLRKIIQKVFAGSHAIPYFVQFPV
jgi:hypothetical protein